MCASINNKNCNYKPAKSFITQNHLLILWKQGILSGLECGHPDLGMCVCPHGGAEGYPHPAQQVGVPPSQHGGKYRGDVGTPTLSGWMGVSPSPKSGWIVESPPAPPPPISLGGGTPLPGDSSTAVLSRRRAIYLLPSRRRTFLLNCENVSRTACIFLVLYFIKAKCTAITRNLAVLGKRFNFTLFSLFEALFAVWCNSSVHLPMTFDLLLILVWFVLSFGSENN